MSTIPQAALAVAAEKDWQEPPDYDSWYAAGVSFVVHFCLVMLAPLFQTLLAPRETLPPAVEVVSVIDSSAMPADPLAGLGGATEELESNSAGEAALPMDSEPMAAIEDVQPIDVTSPELDLEKLLDTVQVAREQADSATASAKAAVAAARQALNKNLGGQAGGGQSGGKGTGRAGRAARWILRFNTGSARSYLLQLGGLDAEIAFPQRGEEYLYFSDLASLPARSVRDLSRENRIFWIDNDPGSYGPVAAELGAGSPPMMIAFFPLDLEQRMLQLELAYRGVASEDEILQTVFESVSRGGGYDVIVVDQKLRR